MTQASESYVDEIGIGSQRLRVTVQGSGPPILLIMGFAGSLELWSPLRRALPGYQTIAYDAPGTGGSKPSPWPLSIGGLARLTDRLCAALGFPTLDVVGFSFGGIVAQHLATAYSERVGRLVLASTSTGVGSVPGFAAALRMLTVPPSTYRSRHFLKTAANIFGGGFRDDPTTASHHLPSREPHVRGWLHQLIAVNTYSSLPRLPFLDQPTLVLAGDDDPLVPLINAKILTRLIPNAELEVIRGGGHMMLLERSEEVGERIRSFLEASAHADAGDQPPANPTGHETPVPPSPQ